MNAVSFHAIPSRTPRTKWVNVIIDTPKGSRNKYKYDETFGLFRLSRVLPAGMQFPYDFGSVPRTRAEDGDALDVLVLMDAPTFPGCLVTVKLLGVLRAVQKEGRKTIRNDRLIATAETPVNRAKARGIEDIAKGRLDEIEHFFVSYNRAQGRQFTPAGRLGLAAAEKILKDAMRAFSQTPK